MSRPANTTVRALVRGDPQRVAPRTVAVALRAIAIALLVLLAKTTTAGAQDLVTPVRVGRADAPLTLTVWAQQDYSHLAARPAIAGVFTSVFDDWARAHPAVQLRVSVMPGLELHKAKLQLAAASGRLPDVASIDGFWLPLLANDVQPLEEYWPAEDRRDSLPFTIQTLSDPAGHVLGTWHETDCRVLFYRKDLMPAPPRTWDELIETASRITREQRVSGDCPPATDRRVTNAGAHVTRICPTAGGGVRGGVRVDLELPLPRAAAPDRRSRAADTVAVPASIEALVDAGSPRVMFNVTVDNRASDHRLRIVFPTGAGSVETARADTAFDVMTRPARQPVPESIWNEAPVSSAPMISVVDAGDARTGATVIGKGLMEYEIVGEEPAIALTPIRAVGDLSRNDLATRPSGHAGPPVATPNVPAGIGFKWRSSPGARHRPQAPSSRALARRTLRRALLSAERMAAAHRCSDRSCASIASPATSCSAPSSRPRIARA